MKPESPAQFDSLLYRFDGRVYEINESEGILTLQLRNRFYLDSQYLFVFWFTVTCVLFHWWWKVQWPAAFRTDEATFFLSLVGLMAAAVMVQIFRYCGIPFTKESWQFDREAGEVRFNSRRLLETSEIVGVRAWGKGRRFYLSLQLRKGKPILIGYRGYSRVEVSWRDDAARLAGFLGVPLEIPGVEQAC